MTHEPYAEILQRSMNSLERIVGEVYGKEKAIAVAEGWLKELNENGCLR
jgi:hypothetical protein